MGIPVFDIDEKLYRCIDEGKWLVLVVLGMGEV
jgi:hypothetical protein